MFIISYFIEIGWNLSELFMSGVWEREMTLYIISSYLSHYLTDFHEIKYNKVFKLSRFMFDVQHISEFKV